MRVVDDRVEVMIWKMEERSEGVWSEWVQREKVRSGMVWSERARSEGVQSETMRSERAPSDLYEPAGI